MNKHYEAQKRWLAKNPDKRNEFRKRNFASTRKFARNSKQSWSTRDLEAVLRHDITDRELGQRIGRSVQAIQVMRSKLKSGEIVIK